MLIRSLRLAGPSGAVYHTGRQPDSTAESYLSPRVPPGDLIMSAPVILEGLDLAALLCSRVCHDLISPVGAVVNGIEVMEDDADEQTKAFAVELIKKSANTASKRFEYCCIPFAAAC